MTLRSQSVKLVNTNESENKPTALTKCRLYIRMETIRFFKKTCKVFFAPFPNKKQIKSFS